MITALGSLEGETHHGGRCIDGCAYQAGVICIPPTNVPSPDENVYVDQTSYMSGHSLMKNKYACMISQKPQWWIAGTYIVHVGVRKYSHKTLLNV